ncbi:MAG: DUF5666 domain-containing protein [Patescibacteria group bacterium]
MKNKKIIAGVAAVVLLGGGFGGGYVFANSQSPKMPEFGKSGNGQFMMRTGGAGGTTRTVGNFTAGEIISRDANGVTIKMQDGSTKIVLVGASTQVMKSTSGTADDLKVGENVTISGSTNSDGSVTAQSVQLRPEGMMFGSTTPRQ